MAAIPSILLFVRFLRLFDLGPSLMPVVLVVTQICIQIISIESGLSQLLFFPPLFFFSFFFFTLYKKKKNQLPSDFSFWEDDQVELKPCCPTLQCLSDVQEKEDCASWRKLDGRGGRRCWPGRGSGGEQRKKKVMLRANSWDMFLTSQTLNLFKKKKKKEPSSLWTSAVHTECRKEKVKQDGHFPRYLLCSVAWWHVPLATGPLTT